MSINQKSGRQTFGKTLFSFRLARRNVIYKARAWSQVNHVLSSACRLKKTLDQGRGYTCTQGTQVLHHQINKIKKKDDYEENKER